MPASAGAEQAGATARAYTYQCRVDAGLTATYDAASKQITADFKVPYAGREAHNIVWGPTSGQEDSDGRSEERPSLSRPARRAFATS